jgi:tetratricopeptide (TPR) repeat protein
MRQPLALIALLLALGTSACSTFLAPSSRPPASAAAVDDMLTRLRSTHNEEEAQMLEVTIRHAWASSGRSAVDNLMTQAVEAVHAGEYDTARACVDRVVSVAPDFAEGWNLRATVAYLRDDYGEALVDIERVLRLEPRHFGALAGLGRIFLELDDKKAALKAFDAALAINPHLNEVAEEADQIREQLAGVPI